MRVYNYAYPTIIQDVLHLPRVTIVMVSLNVIRASNAKISTTFPPGLVAVFSTAKFMTMEVRVRLIPSNSRRNQRYWRIYIEGVLPPDNEAPCVFCGKVQRPPLRPLSVLHSGSNADISFVIYTETRKRPTGLCPSSRIYSQRQKLPL